MSEASKKRTSIEITWLPDCEAYLVQFKASEDILSDVVRDLKKIEPQRRSFDSATRAWTIAAAEFDALRTLATRYFDNARLVEGNRFRDLHTGRTTQQLTLFG